MEFRPYDVSYRSGLDVMLKNGEAYIVNDLLSLVNEHPENTIVLEHDGTIFSIATHTAEHGDTRASLTAFTGERFRGQGIGTAIVKATICNMIGIGIKTIYADFPCDERLNEFASRVGLRPAFMSHLLSYSGEHIQCEFDFASYRDELHEKYQTLQSTAFENLRESTDIKPYYMPYSEKIRSIMASHTDDYFVLERENELIGISSISKNEIDCIAVAPTHRHIGIGRALTANAVNNILDRGHERAYLWVMESNTAAIKLYKSMGFDDERTHCFYLLNLVR